MAFVPRREQGWDQSPEEGVEPVVLEPFKELRDEALSRWGGGERRPVEADWPDLYAVAELACCCKDGGGGRYVGGFAQRI
jgi:hypothetical protein